MNTRQQDIRVEEAKASIVARIDELGKRMREMRHKLDVQRHIVAHPWIATGSALALGVILGALGGNRAKSDSSAKKSAVGAAIGALVTAAIKELVMSQVKGAAKSWLGDDAHEPDRDSYVEH